MTDVRNDVAWLTLDDSDIANALTEPTIERLARGLDEAAEASQVRVAVLTHRGRVFCAGAHLTDGDDRGAGVSALIGLFEQLWSFPKPLVVVVGGAARGAGVGLAALADLVVASEDATFGAPEVRLGMPPTLIAPVLEATIGAAPAAEMLLTGRALSAAEAHRAGLVHRLGPAPELTTLTAEVLDELRLGAPSAQRAAKAMLRESRTRWLLAALRAAPEAAARLVVPHEAAEGLDAFRNRRRPDWSGNDGQR